MYIYIHTYIPTYLRTYLHTYIHSNTYVYVCSCLLFDTDPWQLRLGLTSLQQLRGGGRLKSLGFDMFKMLG